MTGKLIHQVFLSQAISVGGEARGVPDYYVYIMTNKSRTLYTGVTSDLERRVYEHKHKLVPGFTSKYNINMLAWYDAFSDVGDAIEWEKRIKGWLRSKKIALVESKNPSWENLSDGWYGSGDSSLRSE
jgi:putative endonuclease